MTQQEAMDEAKRRWGSRAYTSQDYTRTIEPEAVFYVGDLATYAIGNGRTWEAAFADADRRAIQPEEGASHGSE